MEEVKYIQGDLVMTDGKPFGTKKGVVYVVTASDPNRTFTFKDGTVLKGAVTLDAIMEEDDAYFVETSTWVKHIVPIKLTPAILEANGWEKGELKKGGNARDSYYPYSKKGCIVELRYYPSCDMFLPYIGKKALMNILFLYVHQLQHLLFSLGLNSEMEV